MVRAVERRKPEVLIGRFGIVGAYLKRFAPGLMRRIVQGRGNVSFNTAVGSRP